MKPNKYLTIFCLAMSLSACNGGGGGDGGGDGGNGGGTPTPPPNSGQVVGYVNRILPRPMYATTPVNNWQNLAVVVRDQTTLNELFDKVPTLFDGLPVELRSPDFASKNLIVLGSEAMIIASDQSGNHLSLDDPIVLNGDGLWVGVERCNLSIGVTHGEMPYFRAYFVSVYEAPLLPANVTFHWTSRAGTLTCNSGDINSVRIVQ